MKNFLKNLFSKKTEKKTYQVDISSQKVRKGILEFETFGWQPHEETAQSKSWMCSNFPALITYYFIDGKPDIPAPESEDLIRFYFRQRLKETSKGGLIQCNVLKISDLSVIENLVKIPKSPTGVIYVYTLNFLMSDRSYIIAMQAEEMGMAGVREATLAPKILGADLDMEKWMRDPYDPNYKEGLRMNLAEAEQYDSMFPLHPLSLLRLELIPKLKASLKVRHGNGGTEKKERVSY